MPCPVLANGNIYSAEKADEVLALTGARGLMIGRGVDPKSMALSPDSRAANAAKRSFVPTGRDVLEYVHALYEAVSTPGIRESAQIKKMKKYMNFIGLGVEPDRAVSASDPPRHHRGGFLPRLPNEFLDHDEPMPLEPFSLGLKGNRCDGGRGSICRSIKVS